MKWLKNIFAGLSVVLTISANAQTPRIVSKGLSLDTTYFVINDKKVLLNEFSTGTHVAFTLSGLKGMSVKDGKNFPGLTMKILDNKNKAILDYADLFEEYAEGVDREDARGLSMTLTVGYPLAEGEAYTWYGRVWDKIGKGELIIEMPIKVVEAKDKVGTKTISKGLTCKNTYIFDGVPLETNVVKMGTKLTYVFSKIGGFTPDTNKLVNIGMQIKLLNDEGTSIMEYSDLFRDYGPVDAAKANTLITNLTIGDPILPGNAYTWWVKIWDKSTNKYFESSVVLKIE